MALGLPRRPKVRIERIFWPVVCLGGCEVREPLRLRRRLRLRLPPLEEDPPEWEELLWRLRLRERLPRGRRLDWSEDWFSIDGGRYWVMIRPGADRM